MVSFLRDYCCTFCTYDTESELEARCEACVGRLGQAMEAAHTLGRVRNALRKIADHKMPKPWRDAFREIYGILGDDTSLFEREDKRGLAGDTE